MRRIRSYSLFSMSASRASWRRSMTSEWDSCIRDYTKRPRSILHSCYLTTWLHSQFQRKMVVQAQWAKVAVCWRISMSHLWMIGLSKWACNCNFRRRFLEDQKIDFQNLRLLRGPLYQWIRESVQQCSSLTAKMIARPNSKRKPNTTNSTSTMLKKLSTWW